MMPLLENPDGNTCFGCGPRHARGLRLQFERRRADDGVEEIRTVMTPGEDETGWPGLLHTGLHFTVLFEVSYWAAWELTDVVHVAHGPQTFDQTRLPRVGRPFEAFARVVDASQGGLRTRAMSRTEDGRALGTLQVDWRPARRGLVERAGLSLPAYLLADMEE